MRIGIFGGSFNPPHKMHKQIAIELLEKDYLDKVIYVPTGNNYNKANLLDGDDRIKMIELMIEGYNEKLEVSDFEVRGSLYTINTLNYFKDKFPDDEIYFICGTDNFAEFYTWRNYEEILKNYKILIIARNCAKFDDIIKGYSEYVHNIILANIDMNVISSTKIREEIIENGFTEILNQYMDKSVIEYLKGVHIVEKWSNKV